MLESRVFTEKQLNVSTFRAVSLKTKFEGLSIADQTRMTGLRLRGAISRKRCKITLAGHNSKLMTNKKSRRLSICARVSDLAWPWTVKTHVLSPVTNKEFCSGATFVRVSFWPICRTYTCHSNCREFFNIAIAEILQKLFIWNENIFFEWKATFGWVLL